ncbi:MAG TPA: prepilin-type N-terminal cleavage/methylation domain-containing protein [Bacteroidales bacterium]|nr:prepilin-type N-terminal cleavage/methylation domain-containing protein [Bacteroidales bacterium]
MNKTSNYKKFRNSRKQRGFTLIELLIAMAITTIVSAGIFSAYRSQQNAQLAQKQIVEMQQNLRAAMYIMTREIRMAGYDPHGNSGAKITTAGDGSNGNPLGFTFVADNDNDDNDNDGTTDEPGELKFIEYDLYVGYSSQGETGNDIGRKIGAGNRQALAENIQSLQFTYLDKNGNAMAFTANKIPISDLPDIRSIQIAITATADVDERDYTGGNNRTLTTTVKCRNLGL